MFGFNRFLKNGFIYNKEVPYITDIDRYINTSMYSIQTKRIEISDDTVYNYGDTILYDNKIEIYL